MSTVKRSIETNSLQGNKSFLEIGILDTGFALLDHRYNFYAYRLLNLHTPTTKKTTLQASKASVVATKFASGSAFMVCISARTAQPCGTSSETELPRLAAAGEFIAKMLIMPSMPVTVSTPPNKTPPCLVSLRKELRKILEKEISFSIKKRNYKKRKKKN